MAISIVDRPAVVDEDAMTKDGNILILKGSERKKERKLKMFERLLKRDNGDASPPPPQVPPVPEGESAVVQTTPVDAILKGVREIVDPIGREVHGLTERVTALESAHVEGLTETAKAFELIDGRIKLVEKRPAASQAIRSGVFVGGDRALSKRYPLVQKAFEEKLGNLFTYDEMGIFRLKAGEIIPTSFSTSLSTEEAEAFFTTIFDLSKPMDQITRISTTGKQINLDELTIGDEPMIPAARGADPGNTVTVGEAQRTMTPKYSRAIAALDDQTIIQLGRKGENFVDLLMEKVAQKIGNQLMWAAWQGVAGKAATTKLRVEDQVDGFMYRAAAGGTTVNCATVFTDRLMGIEKLEYAYNTLPAWAQMQTDLRYFTPNVGVANYIADLQAQGSDAAFNAIIAGLSLPKWAGTVIQPVPMLPATWPLLSATVCYFSAQEAAGQTVLSVDDGAGGAVNAAFDTGAYLRLGTPGTDDYEFFYVESKAGAAPNETLTGYRINKFSLTGTTAVGTRYQHENNETITLVTLAQYQTLLTYLSNLVFAYWTDGVAFETGRTHRAKVTDFVWDLGWDVNVYKPAAMILLDRMLRSNMA